MAGGRAGVSLVSSGLCKKFSLPLPFRPGLFCLKSRLVSKRYGDHSAIFTGSVTFKNQLRATTISDCDRKEIIVPNAFITEQFINWSRLTPLRAWC